MTSDHLDRSERLRAMFRQVSSESDFTQLESAVKSSGDDFTLDVGTTGNDDQESALEVLDVLRREGPDAPLDEGDLEAIIMPRYRPVIDIVGGTFGGLESPWQSLGLGDARKNIENAIRSVGRVEIPKDRKRPYAGTGFVVGPGLIMTNRHVAELFAKGLGQHELVFLDGSTAGIDFGREKGAAAGTLLEVKKVEMIHPYWDMALLRVDGLGADRPALKLSTLDPDQNLDCDIAVVGYPAHDPSGDSKYQEMQARIFDNTYNVKRLQPGRIRERADIASFRRLVSALTHDASTLGGSSGSAVVDVKTGQVVGLHFKGEYLVANFAVPTFDLARDSRVVDTGISFEGRVEPRSDFYGPIWVTTDRARDETIPSERRTSPGNEATAPSNEGTSPQAGNTAIGPSGQSVSMTLQLEITVSLGKPS